MLQNELSDQSKILNDRGISVSSLRSCSLDGGLYVYNVLISKIWSSLGDDCNQTSGMWYWLVW